MDDKPPLVFANKVIRRFVDNLFGGQTMILPKDYMVMRVVFRKLGGSWKRIILGDIEANKLVVRIIQAWGTLHEKNRKVEGEY